MTMQVFYIGELIPDRPKVQFRFSGGRTFLSDPHARNAARRAIVPPYVEPAPTPAPAPVMTLSVFRGSLWDDLYTWADTGVWTD